MGQGSAQVPVESQKLKDRASTNSLRKMAALFDYDPRQTSPNPDAEDVELTFRAGDVMHVFGSVDEDGFYVAELLTGERGLVPSNFLEEVNDEMDNSRGSSSHRSPLHGTRSSLALPPPPPPGGTGGGHRYHSNQPPLPHLSKASHKGFGGPTPASRLPNGPMFSRHPQPKHNSSGESLLIPASSNHHRNNSGERASQSITSAAENSRQPNYPQSLQPGASSLQKRVAGAPPTDSRTGTNEEFQHLHGAGTTLHTISADHTQLPSSTFQYQTRTAETERDQFHNNRVGVEPTSAANSSQNTTAHGKLGTHGTSSTARGALSPAPAVPSRSPIHNSKPLSWNNNSTDRY